MNIGNLDSSLQIESFWAEDAKAALALEPITLVMNIKPEKILGLAKAGGRFVLRTYELEKKKQRAYAFEDYLTELGLPADFAVTTVDKCQRTNLFFAAFAVPKRPPLLVQVKIAKEGLSAVATLALEAEGFAQVHRMAAHVVGKTDYLLVAGTNSLLLARSRDKSLVLLHKFESLLAGDLFDACVFRNKFFAVSPSSPFVVEVCASHKVDPASIGKPMAEEKAEEIKFDRYDITKLEIAAGKFHKLDVSRKGDVLYVVGKGIAAVTELNTAKPQKTEAYYADRLFSSVKTLKNGNLLVQENKSNDLCELAPTLKELKRLKGVAGPMLTIETIRNSRHSHDDAHLPWVKASMLVSLVTVKDLSMKEVKNFFGQDGEAEVFPIMCVANTEGDKLFGTALAKGVIRLCFWEKSANARYFTLSELFPNIGIVLTADISQDGGVVFLGGSTNTNYAEGRAIIQAVKLDKKLSYVTDIVLEDKEDRFVSRVRRFEESNRFLALTAKSVYVYEFRNQLFHFLSVVQNVLPGTDALADVVILKSTLFVLPADARHVLKIEFAS